MPFAPRPAFSWRLRTRSLALGPRTLVMAILNVTPDSFSDGGRFTAASDAMDEGLSLLDQGADILDLGGESTRPNATPISPETEQTRVLPVLSGILQARPNAILSIDTYHAATARLAVEAGAEIVNDVSGHLWESDMSAICAALACGTILMHTRGRPADWSTLPSLAPSELIPLIATELTARTDQAIDAGIAPASIVLDPGFGFGKRGAENYELLAHFAALQDLGYPLLAGLSRKRFLAPQTALTGNRLHATVAANTAAILAGAHMVRVHDLLPALEAATIADAILTASYLAPTASSSFLKANTSPENSKI